ncbi:inositol monophosphatase, partial [Microbacteriaceae bacterium K1510]|nr:inositol monophosphatase [Microbacteriaceae bacterium K1510]
PVVGVVYNPITRELFSARKGNGAFLNDQPVRVGIESSLDEALLATGFQAADWQSHSMPVRQIDRVTGKCRSVRIIGAASLDLCWVASGRLTGFWHDGLHPWDVAAGVLIVKEAGGQVTNRSGSPFALTDATLVASNAAIHPAFLQVIET